MIDEDWLTTMIPDLRAFYAFVSPSSHSSSPSCCASQYGIEYGVAIFFAPCGAPKWAPS